MLLLEKFLEKYMGYAIFVINFSNYFVTLTKQFLTYYITGRTHMGRKWVSTD